MPPAAARDIEVTSYMELVLGSQAADVAHPCSRRCSCAPSSCRGKIVLLANRRRRAPDEPEALGVRITPSSKAWPWPHRSSKPTACNSSAAGANCVHHSRMLGGRHSRVQWARYWMRYSRCATPACASGWHRAHRVLDLRGAGPVPQVLELADKHRDSPRTCARRHLRGRRHRCSCGISASTRRRRVSSSNSRDGSCMPTPPHGPSPDAIRRGAAGPQPLWSQGIFGRSAHRDASASRRRTICPWCANSCRRTSTGASSACRWIW